MSIAKTSIASIILASLMLLGLSFSFAHAETDNDDDEKVVGTASITESKALSIAEKAYTGSGRFTDIELEMEHGVLVYAVEYTENDGNEVDVKVNAKSGVVVLIESDEDEAEDDDEGDEDEDEDEKGNIARMQTLINLLNQLIALLRQQGSL